MADIPRQRQVAHPTPLTYLKVAATLGVLTAVEVAVFYIDVLEPAFLAIFLILSVAKFVLVVMFYMHLKFDNRLFSGVFVGGLLLAVAVVVVLMSLFQVLSALANPSEPEDVGGETLVVDPTPTPVPAATPTPQLTPTPKPTPSPGATAIPTTIPPGPDDELVAKGREIYLVPPPNVGPQALWCSICHKIESVPESIGGIGPELTHIGTIVADRKPGMSAEEYIRESIREPEAFITPDFLPGLMTTAITQGLTDEQVDALVAFLLVQK